MPMPLDQALQEILEGVEQRWHFSLSDNMLDYVPNKDDITAAVFDAADDINSFAPNTMYTVVDMFEATDTRWRSLLYLGTAKNVIQMLVNLWTQNGFDATVGEISAPSKLPDYKSLYDTLVAEFDKKVERMKKTSQKFVRGISSTGYMTVNYLYGNSPFIQIFNSRIRLR